jgi:hypothetical protein
MQEKINRFSQLPARRDLHRLLVGSQALSDKERRKVEQFRDLLDRIFEMNPERRLTPKEACGHPFVTEKM